MPSVKGPNMGLDSGWTAGENGGNTGMDANIQKIDALLQLSVTSVLAAPAVSTDGTRYIVAASPTGAFAGKANNVAVRVAGAWVFYAPAQGWSAWNVAAGSFWNFDGTNWVNTAAAAGGASPFLLVSNPGATPFAAVTWTPIPFFTPTETTGISLASNTTITLPTAGLYLFECEVLVTVGATSNPPAGTVLDLVLADATVPTALRAGYSATVLTTAGSTTLRLSCIERITAGSVRKFYLRNGGAAGYQVVAATGKAIRIGA